MRVLYDKEFSRFVKRSGLTEEMLCVTAKEIERGLVDAHLGGFLIKKRVRKPGMGKSGGYRTIVAYQHGNRLMFLHGFDKNDKDNITSRELSALHEFGDLYMSYAEAKVDELVACGLLTEVRCHEQNT
jgi:hypothetical protein